MDIEKLFSICLITSLLSIMIGYFLWSILIPIQDYNLSTDEQLREAQKEAAINAPLGKLLLFLGFIGLAFTILGYIWMYIHMYKSRHR